MNTTPATPPPTQPLQPSPATSGQSHYHSAYQIVENFVFNQTLVTGCLHRPATGDESVAVTEVLYGPHHLTIEDKKQTLFHHLCHHLSPTKPKTTI